MILVPPPPPNPLLPELPLVFDTDFTTVIDMTRAKNIAPDKVDKSIWHLQDSDRILKRGPNVKLAEAKALKLVASSTQVPVPEVFGAYEKNGFGHIFMSRADGRPLAKVLNMLDKDQALMKKVTAQLSGFVSSWMSLRGDYFGSIGLNASRDVFFQHLPAINNPDRDYGPFKTRTEYCNGLIEVLHNSRPNGELDVYATQLVERIQRFGDGEGTAVFCHGDLTPANILVDDQMNVSAIVDMGVSGFSIPEREYFEAKSRARHPVWSSMVDQIVPKIPDDTYALLEELERELVRYSGI